MSGNNSGNGDDDDGDNEDDDGGGGGGNINKFTLIFDPFAINFIMAIVFALYVLHHNDQNLFGFFCTHVDHDEQNKG